MGLRAENKLDQTVAIIISLTPYMCHVVHNGLEKMAGAPGFEPGTYGFGDRRSTS